MEESQIVPSFSLSPISLTTSIADNETTDNWLTGSKTKGRKGFVDGRKQD